MKNLSNVLKTIFLISIFLGVGPAQAQQMDSSDYSIKFPNINFGAGNTSSDSYNVSTTVGQLAANEFSSLGYIVKAGFQYRQSIAPFMFSVSDSSIDLGSLVPQTPTTATTNLTVSLDQGETFQVTAQEEGPLTTLYGNNTITDTSCNGRKENCTEKTSAVWNSNTAYGFGYTIAGDNIPQDFRSPSYFRRFPDSLANETPVTIMEGNQSADKSEAVLTFKANISPLQGTGSYETIVKFVATPGF